jgi:hypothetical protein
MGFNQPFAAGIVNAFVFVAASEISLPCTNAN